MAGRPYEIIDHTADVGIVTHGDDLAEVIENAAFAMFDLMYAAPAAPASGAIDFETSADAPPDLLVEVLSELLYRAEAADVAFTDFAVEVQAEEARVRARVHPIAGIELEGPPIKAVTYHRLRCEPSNDGWTAQVIFDV